MGMGFKKNKVSLVIRNIYITEKGTGREREKLVGFSCDLAVFLVNYYYYFLSKTLSLTHLQNPY